MTTDYLISMRLKLGMNIQTNAFDTLYIGCEKFSQHDLYPIAIGGVR